MASYIAPTVAASTGADFSLAAGASTTLSLSAAAGLQPLCIAQVQIKSAAATYQTIGILDKDAPVLVLTAIGTFRVVKSDCASLAFGVERD